MKIKNHKGISSIFAIIVIAGIGLIFDAIIYLHSLSIEVLSIPIVRSLRNYNQAIYECPKGSVLDCIDQSLEENKQYCDLEYKKWIKKNCPEVEIKEVEETSGYICPEKEGIDCMPIVSEENAKYCFGDYHKWLKENCPNVQFVY